MGDGLKTGLDLAMGEVGAAVAAEQLPLLPGMGEEDRRRGRPGGSRNKSTQYWRDLVLGKHRSPLLVLADIYDQDPLTLARSLGCKPLEAIELQRRCAEAVAPYVHGKMPVEIDLGGELPVLQLVDPRALLASLDSGLPTLDLSSLQILENQCVSDVPEAPVAQLQSTSEPNHEGSCGCQDDARLISDLPEDGQ